MTNSPLMLYLYSSYPSIDSNSFIWGKIIVGVIDIDVEKIELNTIVRLNLQDKLYF
jgi:hypothetical protein